jgi:hypothetical protein
MLPLLPFAAGLLAGAVAVRLMRSEGTRAGLEKLQDKTRGGLGKAQDKLRDATLSGLSAVENSSAAMRRRLSAGKDAAPQAAVPAQPDAPSALDAAPAKPKRAPARTAGTSRKRTGKTSAGDATPDSAS